MQYTDFRLMIRSDRKMNNSLSSDLDKFDTTRVPISHPDNICYISMLINELYSFSKNLSRKIRCKSLIFNAPEHSAIHGVFGQNLFTEMSGRFVLRSRVSQIPRYHPVHKSVVHLHSPEIT